MYSNVGSVLAGWETSAHLNIWFVSAGSAEQIRGREIAPKGQFVVYVMAMIFFEEC